MPELIRVGHKGADLIAPGNTTASFDAAIEAGVDMIEFDVLPDPARKRLVLAHDYTHDLKTAPSLEEGLAHLGGLDVRLDVDLKLTGYEDRVVAALREHDLLDRCLISSMERASLHRLRAIDPSIPLGWSVPKAKRDYTRSPLHRLPALGLLAAARQTFPRRAGSELRSGFCDAIMAYWRLITPRLAHTVRDAGGELYAWTVDDARTIDRLAAMGVTGVITNDPRLFVRAP
ncbi:MAG: glycerophosphoryl diester phosphodiesterase [Solirubrobacteraceae bacterium]|jgi:glycerophosphoryl diester phosphodiesterase|nr:glycerophosphoryl diester phosphodiesterase [Solirubrobacteraceae bacterium]